MGAPIQPRCLAPREAAGDLGGRGSQGGDRALHVGVGRLARQRQPQHARPVVEADRLERRARARRLRRAGRPGGGLDAASLERVEQRLGRQAGERQRGDVRRARRAQDAQRVGSRSASRGRAGRTCLSTPSRPSACCASAPAPSARTASRSRRTSSTARAAPGRSGCAPAPACGRSPSAAARNGACVGGRRTSLRSSASPAP